MDRYNFDTTEFVSYKQALELKALGFVAACFGHYLGKEFYYKAYAKQADEITLRPLKTQAFKWFRKTYQLHSHVTSWYSERFYYHIEDMCHPRRYEQLPHQSMNPFNESSTQEDAEALAIDNLIELAKINLKR